MEPFASVKDYEARYGEYSDKGMLETCLMSCSSVVMSAMERAGASWEDPSERLAYDLMDVTRGMANRCLPAPDFDIPAGATSASIGAGGFSQSFGFATPYATPTLTRAERRRLIPGASVAFVEVCDA